MENEDDMMTMAEFKKTYTTLKNLADGNCLFLSVEQLDDRFSHDQLRNQVCEFHKNFVANPSDYPPDSFLQHLAISLQATDPSDYYHKDRICNNYEYANLGDILILSHLLDRPFIVFINNDKKQIFIEKYNSQSNQPPIRLRYYHAKKNKKGGDHYEAVLLKSESPNRPSPNTRRSSPKPTKKSSTRKASPKLKKSPKKPSPKKPSPKKPSPKPKKSPKKSPKKASPKPKKAVSKKASPKPKPKSSTKKASISKFINKHPLLGREVAKYFDDDEFPYLGHVASYKHPYYRIVYNDGDEEDLTVAQTEKIVLP